MPTSRRPLAQEAFGVSADLLSFEVLLLPSPRLSETSLSLCSRYSLPHQRWTATSRGFPWWSLCTSGKLLIQAAETQAGKGQRGFSVALSVSV